MAASAFSAWSSNPYLQSATTGAEANPFSTVSNTKSTEVDKRLAELFKSFDLAKTSGASGVADFATVLKSLTPKVEAQTDSDINTLDALFNGQSAGELAGIRGRRKAALAGVVDRSMGDLSRLLGTTQLSLGGGGRSLGTGSFLSKLGLDKSADINARAAMDDAEAERGDFMDLLTRRLSAGGQRQKLTDALAGRSLLPFGAETQVLGGLTSALGGLSAQDLLNKFYGLKGNENAFST